MTSANTYQIENPERYVDATGAFVARFVNRAQDGNSVYFNLLERLEGSIQ